MSRLSIRLRLSIWYAAALLAGLLLFGTTIYFSLSHRLTAGVDARLAERVEGLRMVLQVEGGMSNPAQLRVELVEFAEEVPDGDLISLLSPARSRLLPGEDRQPVFPPGGGPPHYQTVQRAGQRYRVLSATVHHSDGDFPATVAAPLAETEATLVELRALLLLSIPLLLAVASAGGYWLSRRALRPVAEITETARGLGLGNLSARLLVPRTGDELERMSETWNAMLDRLETSVGRIRQFTSDASHELRTPLALISTTAELALRRERPAEDYRRALSEVRQEAAHMTALAEGLLELARADSAVRLQLREEDVNGLVSDVLEAQRLAAEAHGLRLQSRLIAGVALAQVDAQALRRLLMILLDNAVKYTPAGGTVTVATSAAPEGVLLEVEDTGVGIAEEALPHIFERFYRVDAARSAGAGFGLGLAIAQQLARAHASELRVESRVGAGSRFFLTLPAG